MDWKTIVIIAGVFLIGLLLGRNLSGRGGGGGGSLPAAPARPATPAEGGLRVLESGTHGVRLLDGGPNKIAVIKELRALTGLGLKETKDLVEAAPCRVIAHVSRESAERAAVLLRNAGATAETD